MTTEVCGFDQWMDNHYAYDGNPHNNKTHYLDAYAQKAQKMGLQYQWWRVGNVMGEMTQIYVVDPTGYGV